MSYENNLNRNSYENINITYINSGDGGGNEGSISTDDGSDFGIFDVVSTDTEDTETPPIENYDIYNGSDWEFLDSSTKTTGFWFWKETTGYFKAPNGMELTFDPSDDVIIKFNKKTGELLIENAKNLEVNGTKENDNLIIKNSEIKEIDTKAGDDTIKIIDNSYMHTSSADNFNTGKGNDTVIIQDSSILDEINTGKGDDVISVSQSWLREVNTESGNDEISLNEVTPYEDNTLRIMLGDGNNKAVIHNSNLNVLSSGKGLDVFHIYNSNINSLSGGNGDDSIVINNSNVDSIHTDKGKDDLLINDSVVKVINSGVDDDKIVLNNSHVNDLNAENGDDKIDLNNGSSINNYDGGSGTNLLSSDEGLAISQNENGDEVILTDTLLQNLRFDETTSVQAVNVTQGITSQYSDRELTSEEQYYALTINLFENQLESIKTQFEAQENADGIVGDTFNIVKNWLDLGVSKEEIKNAIAQQEKMINEMEAALNSEDSSDFEDVFKKWTGVEYNQENLSEFLEYQQLYSFIVAGETQIGNFVGQVCNPYECPTMEDVYNLFVEYYGEETALDKLNGVLNNIVHNGGTFGEKEYKITITKDLQVKSTTSDETWSLAEWPNMIDLNSNEVLESLIDDFNQTLEKEMNFSINAVQAKYSSSQLSVFGTNGCFQKIIDEYCLEQNNIENTVGTAVQMTGMALMVAGGLLTFACPPAGGVIMTAGRYTSLLGTFLDNALDLTDSITSEDGLSEEKALEIFKETFQDAALYLSGMAINGVAESAHVAAAAGAAARGASKSLEVIVGWAAEVGTDTALSLLSDLVITGEIDLAGEGISQLLGILSGIAGAKIKSYYDTAFAEADIIFKANDVDGAYDYLKSMGISDKQIYKAYGSVETERIIEYYKTTGDYDSALKMLEDSKILSYDMAKSKQNIEDMCLTIEQDKVLKMIQSGADYDTVAKYIDNSPILSEADFAYFTHRYDGIKLIDTLSENGLDYTRYKDVDFATSQGMMIMQDMELILKANKENVNVNDLMVPTYNNPEIAAASVKPGDVFEVEGSRNIFLKTDNGYKKLNISKEKYCELFPPVDRYASRQQYSGDCYLVASLNSMMSNPDARGVLLSCITENADGSVTVKLPKASSEITLEAGKDITSLDVDPNKAVSGALGMQLLEYAYKVETYVKDNPNAVLKINSEISSAQNRLNEIWRMDFQSEFSSPEEFIRAVTENGDNFMKKYNLDITSEKFYNLVYDIYDNKDNPILSEYINSAIMLVLGCSADSDLITQFKTDVLSDDLICNYSSIMKIRELQNSLVESPSKLYDFSYVEKNTGHGGYSSNVFNSFGLPAYSYFNDDIGPAIDKLIADPSSMDGLVITAGTIVTKQQWDNIYNDVNHPNYNYFHTEEGKKVFEQRKAAAPDSIYPGLATWHMYSLEVIYEDGEPMIKVTNPWGAGASLPQMITMTVDEFKQNFDSIYIAKIK